jgi:ribosome-associated protein
MGTSNVSCGDYVSNGDIFNVARFDRQGAGVWHAAPVEDLPVAEGVVIPARDLSWSAARASGPGGQNVNKVASKVDLRFDLEGTTALSAPQKARLRVIVANRLDGEGRVQVTSQAGRDQAQNLEVARETLASLIRRALVPPKPRRPTKPTRGSRERRLAEKRHGAAKKRERRSRSDD